LLAPLPVADFVVQPLAFTVKKGVSYIMSISEILSDLETSVFDFSQIDLSDFSLKGMDTNFAMWFAIFIVAVFIVLLFRPFKDKKAKMGKPGKIWILLLVAVILVGVYFIQNSQSDGVIDPDSVTVGFVDVGQGSCSVIIKDDFTAVIDCGGTTEPGEEAIRFIQRYGDGEIDVMIISHLHDDHVNGITDVLSSAKVGKIYVPYTAGDETYEDELFTAAAMFDVYVEQVEEDMVISENGIELELYTQHLDPANEQNDNSIVVKLLYNDFSTLFTGDIGKKAEKAIVNLYPTLTAEVLAVPHHGSASSSTEAFLATVQPRLSIISVAEKNSYGHPTPAAMERLEIYGDILCTKDCGNIRIISDGYDYEIYTDNEIS
jgi:competence protein ComEC